MTALAVGVIGTLAACGGSGPRSDATKAAPSSQELRIPLAPGRERLASGVHFLDLVARESEPGLKRLPWIKLTLPSGWFNYKGIFIGKGRQPFKTVVAFWDVAEVYADPCRWSAHPMIDPGRGIARLASVLARQPMRNATRPRDVVLAGVRGKYLQLSVPRNIDFASCDSGTFESWTARGWASDRYNQAPGQVDRIWILNVGGERLVVDAAYLATATARDRAELDRVVDSIRFAY